MKKTIIVLASLILLPLSGLLLAEGVSNQANLPKSAGLSMCPFQEQGNPINLSSCYLPGFTGPYIFKYKSWTQEWYFGSYKMPDRASNSITLTFDNRSVGNRQVVVAYSYYVNCTSYRVMPKEVYGAMPLSKNGSASLPITTDCTYNKLLQTWPSGKQSADMFGTFNIVTNNIEFSASPSMYMIDMNVS